MTKIWTDLEKIKKIINSNKEIFNQELNRVNLNYSQTWNRIYFLNETWTSCNEPNKNWEFAWISFYKVVQDFQKTPIIFQLKIIKTQKESLS
jgi:hypothetical protein